MPLLAKGGEGYEFELTQAGSYQAVIFNVFDLGMVTNSFKGNEKTQHKISVGFELPSLHYTTGKYAGEVVTKYKDYALSLYGESGLAKLIPVLLGRQLNDDEVENGFDVETLIGKNCILTITHEISKTSGRSYAKISGIGGIVNGMPILQPTLLGYTPEFIKSKLSNTKNNGQYEDQFYDETKNDTFINAEKIKLAMNQINSWVNSGHVTQVDVNATIKVVCHGLKRYDQMNNKELDTVLLRIKKLYEMNSSDITRGTGFDPEPVQPTIKE